MKTFKQFVTESWMKAIKTHIRHEKALGNKFAKSPRTAIGMGAAAAGAVASGIGAMGAHKVGGAIVLAGTAMAGAQLMGTHVKEIRKIKAKQDIMAGKPPKVKKPEHKMTTWDKIKRHYTT